MVRKRKGHPQDMPERNIAEENKSIKSLKKLKRSELLEIMLAQSREIDSLRRQLDEANKKLEDKRIPLMKNGMIGTIADASLQLTDIFEEAQKAANLYVYNVKRIVDQTPEGMKAAEILRKMKEEEEQERE